MERSGIFALAALQLLSFGANALSVIQWQDNMGLSANHFLELTNNNEASKLSDNPPSIIQNFQFDLVSPRQASPLRSLLIPIPALIATRRPRTTRTTSLTF